jgi:archaemetzincin
MPGGVLILDAARLGAAERERLAPLVGARFGVPVRCGNEPLDVESAFDGARRQYNAAVLMAAAAERAAASGEKCLVVAAVDLFVPVLTFVFGQAALGGDAGVVSIHRLANEFYGMPRDDALLRRRLEKEVVHELGHMFGLYHCHQFECVMRSSTYVEEIDLKREDFCPACEARVRELGRPGAAGAA